MPLAVPPLVHGHKQTCEEIHRGGNAEQYHADKKYKKAVAAAVAKCTYDTKGQNTAFARRAEPIAKTYGELGNMEKALSMERNRRRLQK